MLARINWTFFFKPEIFESSLEGLLGSMTETFAKQQPNIDPVVSESGDINFHGMNVNVNLNRNTGQNVMDDEYYEGDLDDEREANQAKSNIARRPTGLRYDFWDRNFDNRSEVPWTEFKKKFESDYRDKIIEEYSEDRYKFFVNLIYKDIFDLKKSVKRNQFDAFCEGNPDADMHRFYNRLQEYATGYYAMVEVFSMSSSLRLTTIQNLGKYGLYFQIMKCSLMYYPD